MTIEEKAKTRCELGFPCSSCTEAYAKSCGMIYAKEKWVLVSVAQQEIDDCKASWQALKNTIPKFDAKILYQENQLKYCNRLIDEMQRERGLQKQKLQAFYDTLVAMVPKTVKIEEYDKATKESWIVQTADPSEWSMFIDSLDVWLAKFKEMLK